MKKKKTSKVSLGDIAKAAGISKSAVCFALQNRPKVSKATRMRVLRIAERLGYMPDARLTSLMATVRDARAKDLLPIAWLNTHPLKSQEGIWHKFKYMSPWLEGAQERCRQLGYYLEEIWTHQPGMTMRRVSQILRHRGIEGVIVTYPARHIHLQWDYIACIALGGALIAPRLHRVIPDCSFNLTLALKILRRYGYHHIGICLSEMVDRFNGRILRSIAQELAAKVPSPDRIPAIFYPEEDEKIIMKQLAPWIRRYRPEVIVTSDGDMVDRVQALGLRVPEDIGVIHLALDDDVLDWAGIHSNKREMGATAAEWVISMVQNHKFGLPCVALNISIRGSWHPGRTLLTPKPK